MRNRVYDPIMGRFYQTDPIGLTGDFTNLYRFSGNNPLLGGDPLGLQGSADENLVTPDLTFSLGPSDAFDPSASFTLSSSGYSASYETYLNSIFGVSGENDVMSWEADLNYALPAFVPSSSALVGWTFLSVKSSIPSNAFAIHLADSASPLNPSTGAMRAGGPSDMGDFQLLTKLTGPQAIMLKGAPVWDKFIHRMVFGPPGFSLSNYIAAAEKISYDSWKSKVDHTGADWDIKTNGTPDEWGQRFYRDAGNIVYGASGRANRVPGIKLHGGGGVFKFFHGDFNVFGKDYQRDQHMIQIGIDYYDSGGR